MKKTISIAVLIVFFIVLLTALFTDGFRQKPFHYENEKSIEAIEFYRDAVNLTRNKKDFDVEITTSAKLKKIDCSNAILNTLIKGIVNHRIGYIEDETETYQFVNGVLSTDSTVVPRNIIQPANSEICDESFDGVLLSNVYDNRGLKRVILMIEQEQASFESTQEAYKSIGKYDIHKNYPEINALAENHSVFLDITSVIPRMQKLFMKNNAHDHNPGDYGPLVPDFGTNGEIIGIEDGVCFLGDTTITAVIGNDGLLNDVVIYAPVGVEVDVRLSDREIKAVVEFEIKQHYIFNY